jgi:hypothetical protein
VTKTVFLSYAGEDAFEASLLQYAIETSLSPLDIKVWTFHRDQSRYESQVAQSLKEHVRRSDAFIFLVSPTTLDSGASQWMELAYADAFEIPTFILMHHLRDDELRQRGKGVPPRLLSGQRTQAVDWKNLVEEIRAVLV